MNRRHMSPERKLRPCYRPSGARRAGFTLVEILLAMGLLVVVVGFVYSGLETFRRVTTMGRDQTAEQQLSRAIRARLLTDLRSVRFAPPEAIPDETAADDSADPAADPSAAGSASTTSGAEAAQAVPVPEVGVAGDAQSLTIYSSLPGRGLNYAPGGVALDPSARVSDLRTVVWFVAGDGGTLAAAVAGRDGPGLARLEGDTPAVAAAETNGDVDGLLAACTLLAPEVTAIQFRYFDGVDWVGSWDSAVSGSLPRAIEVQFAVDLDGPADPRALPGTDRAPVATRLVVCPPLSEPSAEAML